MNPLCRSRSLQAPALSNDRCGINGRSSPFPSALRGRRLMPPRRRGAAWRVSPAWMLQSASVQASSSCLPARTIRSRSDGVPSLSSISDFTSSMVLRAATSSRMVLPSDVATKICIGLRRSSSRTLGLVTVAGAAVIVGVRVPRGTKRLNQRRRPRRVARLLRCTLAQRRSNREECVGGLGGILVRGRHRRDSR